MNNDPTFDDNLNALVYNDDDDEFPDYVYENRLKAFPCLQQGQEPETTT